MSPAGTGLATAMRVRPLIEIGEAEFAIIVHSEGLRPLYGLLVQLGRSALPNIDVIHKALATSGALNSDALLQAGWHSLNRLASSAERLSGPSRSEVGRELERMAGGLLARQEGFAVAFTEDIEHIAAQRRKDLANATIQAVEGILGRPLIEAQEARVLAQLSEDLRHAPTQLTTLWKHFNGTAGTDSALRNAAREAAAQAKSISALLRGNNTSAERELWGHLVRVRGPLGEGYGLHCQPWLDLLKEEIARATGLTAKLGPGHEVMYLTQAEHNLRLNGREGADALVAIVDAANGTLYEVARVQVKVANVSEAALQSAKDAARSIGHEAGMTNRGLAYYQFNPGATTSPVGRIVSSHPDVATNVYLVNASGSRTRKQDLAALKVLGARVTELQLDLTVTDFTHLSLSVIESALKAVR